VCVYTAGSEMIDTLDKDEQHILFYPQKVGVQIIDSPKESYKYGSQIFVRFGGYLMTSPLTTCVRKSQKVKDHTPKTC
jgi:hypothetical protein